MSDTKETPSGAVDPKLLEILVCPVTRGPLSHDREAGELVSTLPQLKSSLEDATEDDE